MKLKQLENTIHQSDIDEVREMAKKFPSLIPIILTFIGIIKMNSITGFTCLCLALFLSIYLKKKRMYMIVPIIGIIFSSVVLGIFVLIAGFNWLRYLLLM